MAAPVRRRESVVQQAPPRCDPRRERMCKDSDSQRDAIVCSVVEYWSRAGGAISSSSGDPCGKAFRMRRQLPSVREESLNR